MAGCCTDGRYFIFATKPGHDWNVKDPVPVNEQTCRRFLDYFFALSSDIALLPEYLAEDFSADNVRTQRTVKALYQAHPTCGSGTFLMMAINAIRAKPPALGPGWPPRSPTRPLRPASGPAPAGPRESAAHLW
ncbi:MAG TPA: hypothetical protein PKI20_03050 [Verrucomicrobiota bacterium]|nr:hypothetical protein [Verrucomicrobiota bacterium]HQL76715.1 hypothetical protein [Verrucomicrobiota bacterium]